MCIRDRYWGDMPPCPIGIDAPGYSQCHWKQSHHSHTHGYRLCTVWMTSLLSVSWLQQTHDTHTVHDCHFSRHTDCMFLCAQEKSAVPTVVDLVTASPTVPNSRQYRTNRHRTSVARTTWRRALQTGRTTWQTVTTVLTETRDWFGRSGVGPPASAWHVRGRDRMWETVFRFFCQSKTVMLLSSLNRHHRHM